VGGADSRSLQAGITMEIARQSWASKYCVARQTQSQGTDLERSHDFIFVSICKSATISEHPTHRDHQQDLVMGKDPSGVIDEMAAQLAPKLCSFRSSASLTSTLRSQCLQWRSSSKLSSHLAFQPAGKACTSSISSNLQIAS